MSQHYTDYLQLETLLNAQHPVSFLPANQPAHDEMLFIVTHQAYELWFRQILFELDSILSIMQQPEVNDNSPQLQTLVHRMHRINSILKLLVEQVSIMETMTPMDFLDFRDLLRPASGFQSLQFRLLEVKLGLAFHNRHQQEHYTSALRETEREKLAAAEQEPCLLNLLNKWLERMPFFSDSALWQNFQTTVKEEEAENSDEPGIFWKHYRQLLAGSLSPAEAANLQRFDQAMMHDDSTTEYLSPAAKRAALFIMLYRGYPLLQQPFQLINAVLETDELLSNWRYRHMNMVHRMIDHRVGTGGSSGENYLKGAADKHYIFKGFAMLTSFLIESRNLPKLPWEVQRKLGFTAGG